MSEKLLKHNPVVTEDEVVYTSPGEWIKVKLNGEFYYTERKGADSIAFVLFANNTDDLKRIGLVKEFKKPVNQAIISAFGGSIDHEKYHDNLFTLVQDEALEESGFKVEFDDIEYYGKVFVSSMMNQFCHLFGITVNKFTQGLKTTTNPEELKSTIEWLTLPEVINLQDWKAILIVTKRMASNNSLVKVKSSMINEQQSI